MQPHPSPDAVNLTLTGIGVLCVGMVANQPAIVAWGGALLLGLQLARSATLLGVTRVRASGFEMLWNEERSVARMSRNETLTLAAVVRNRDTRAVRYANLRAIASPHLSVVLEPASGEVPAGGTLAVTARVEATRVGRHGVFGLSLEVQGGPGLYEVPLTFSNPFGIEVCPHVYATRLRPARGGRSRVQSDSGKPGTRPHGSYDLRELRAYQAGDPFKRVAWKASARRGQLLVREFDQEQRDIVWLVLDASLELWSGPSGSAPLDRAIEQLAAVAENHLRHGDHVGLVVVARRVLAWLPPEGGLAQANRILEALSFQAACYDAARSTYDEADCATRVVEHLRPFDPDLAAGLRAIDLERVARRAARAIERAPFRIEAPRADSDRERVLRHYLAAFGIESPPRLEPDRPHTDLQLLAALERITRAAPRPSLVTICSPAPDASRKDLLSGLARRKRVGLETRWLPMNLTASLNLGAISERQRIARYALQLNTESVERNGRAQLRRLGIRSEAAHLRRRKPHVPDPGVGSASDEREHPNRVTQSRALPGVARARTKVS